MLSLTIDATNGELIIAGLGRIPGRLHTRLLATMRRVGQRLQRQVLREQLSGQALRARKGPLHRAVTARVTSTDEHEVAAHVGIFGGPPETYARFHELQSGRTVTVREHLRRSRSGTASLVRAYSYYARRRSFLQPTLKAHEREIVADVGMAVREALARGH